MILHPEDQVLSGRVAVIAVPDRWLVQFMRDNRSYYSSYNLALQAVLEAWVRLPPVKFHAAGHGVPRGWPVRVRGGR